MDSFIKAELNNEEIKIKLIPKGILINNQKIFVDSISSLQIKNSDANFLLKLIYNEHTIVLKFDNPNLRDLIKNIIQQPDSPFYSYPTLLLVYQELNISYSQFINYFKNSYFFSIKNEINFVDRAISKFTNDCFNFAGRINSASVMEMVNSIEDSRKEEIGKDVDFVPIFPKLEECVEINQPVYGIELKIEELEMNVKFEKEDLEILKKYKIEGANKEMIESITKKYNPETIKYLKRLINVNINKNLS